MTISAPPPGLQPEDYEEIEAAVMETARGRWFLAEYGRRARAADSGKLLAALERLETRLEAQGALAPIETFTVAERLAELAWSLRERGVEDFVCGKIDALAREFSGGVRVAPRRMMESRPAMRNDERSEAQTSGAPPAAGAVEDPPAAEEKSTAREGETKVLDATQSDTETFQPVRPLETSSEPGRVVELTARAPSVPPVDVQSEAARDEAALAAASADPVVEPSPPIDPRLAALSWLDGLPLVDRMALFA